MERAPLPPHERSWRHPSEVAADTRREITAEQPSRSTRTVALLGGTATIALFGVAVFSLTPAAGDGPTATGSTPVRGLSSAVLAAPSTTSPVSAAAAGNSAIGPAPVGPLVTAVGDDGIGVLPSRTVLRLLGDRPEGRALRLGPLIEMVGRSSPTRHAPDAIAVSLPDGSTTMASVVDTGDGDGLATVRLEGSPDEGLELAATVPDPDDIVTVVAPEPVEVEWQDLESDTGARLPADADVPDGAAVLDESGHLVGIYTEADQPDGGRLIPIDDVVDATATPD